MGFTITANWKLVATEKRSTSGATSRKQRSTGKSKKRGHRGRVRVSVLKRGRLRGKGKWKSGGVRARESSQQQLIRKKMSPVPYSDKERKKPFASPEKEEKVKKPESFTLRGPKKGKKECEVVPKLVRKSVDSRFKDHQIHGSRGRNSINGKGRTAIRYHLPALQKYSTRCNETQHKKNTQRKEKMGKRKGAGLLTGQIERNKPRHQEFPFPDGAENRLLGKGGDTSTPKTPHKKPINLEGIRDNSNKRGDPFILRGKGKQKEKKEERNIVVG